MTEFLNYLNRKITKKLAVVLLIPLSGFTQTLTLEQANELARKNYPLFKQKELITQTEQLTIENLSKGYFPQLNITGQASYQSEVTKVEVPIPGFQVPSLSKDQYKIVADVNQVIFDGGAIKQQKIVQKLNANVEQQKLEVELYRLKERVNQVFFGILLMEEQINLLKIAQADLQAGLKRVQAQVDNGTALRSNLNSLKAELLKTDQRFLELKENKSSLLAALGLLTGTQPSENAILIKPVITSNDGTGMDRPELKMFQGQTKLIAQQNKLIDVKLLPKFSGFFQGGYGRPGLNFLKNDFTTYYLSGLRLNWQLSNFYSSSKERRLLKLSMTSVDLQKETFLLNTNIQLQQQELEIQKWKKLIDADREIISLRTSIKEAAKAQLDNEVITATDYIREVNAEDQAKHTLATHQLQLLQSQVNYQIILGK